jgi:hypothetical protein
VDGSHEVYFDGSNVGLASTNVDAFHILSNGHILLSTSGLAWLAGVGYITSQDIVEFTPTSLGRNSTTGTFAMYFDGSDVGLSTSGENIDGVSVLSDGRVLISTTDRNTVPGLATMEDEDIIAFAPTSLGANTAGSWSLYFDGSDVGLSSSSTEDIDAIFVTGDGILYLSTIGNFSVPGISGAKEDVVGFRPTTLGSSTSETYITPLVFDGSAYGLSSFNVDGYQPQN